MLAVTPPRTDRILALELTIPFQSYRIQRFVLFLNGICEANSIFGALVQVAWRLNCWHCECDYKLGPQEKKGQTQVWVIEVSLTVLLTTLDHVVNGGE